MDSSNFRNNNVINQRNNSIDFLRGIAVISVIAIHTAWWSGCNYLPLWFSNLFLFIDIPIFMFISGVCFNYIKSIVKNLKGIVKLWKKWIFFIIIYSIILIIFFRPEFSINNLINWLFFFFPQNNSLQVVGGSIWFIPVYIKVSMFCSIIISYYNLHCKTINDFKYILLFMIIIIGICTFSQSFLFFDMYISLYSFFYLLGYYSSKKKFKSWLMFFLGEIALVLITYFVFNKSGIGISNVQDIKFPPNIYYLLFASLSVIPAWFFKDNYNVSSKNPVNYLGKNAIFFFFSQGISSSLLYFILPLLSLKNVYLLFLVLLFINIVLSISFGIILVNLYNIIEKIQKKIIGGYNEKREN